MKNRKKILNWLNKKNILFGEMYYLPRKYTIYKCNKCDGQPYGEYLVIGIDGLAIPECFLVFAKKLAIYRLGKFIEYI